MTQSHLHSVDPRARFEAGEETTDNGTTPPAPPSGTSSRNPQKPRADKPLPTDRLKFDNQVKVLTAVAQTSGNARRGMSAKAMSAAINLGGETGGLNSRFFRSIGWFEVVGRGEYTASPGLLAWTQHLNIDPEGQDAAAAVLRQEFKDSWVWDAVGDLITVHPISTKLVLLELAKAAGANNHNYQLDTIVDWMVWVGLVDRLGDQVRLSDSPDEASADDHSDEIPADDDVADTPLAADDLEPTRTGNPTTETIDNEAIVSFSMNVRLTADDLRSLDDQQRDFLLAFAERLRG